MAEMGSVLQLCVVYVVGGVTFLPLVILLIFIHAYLTFPTHPTIPESTESLREKLERRGDDEEIFKCKTRELGEKFAPRNRDVDVAAGYFAVCREFVPGGINGKPPERTSPAGEIVPAESPSVYQSVYRSIFDRNKTATLNVNKGAKAAKRARNVFFVALRYDNPLQKALADHLDTDI
jgi:hypothetical protein